MADYYSTDEQQVERLRKWWKEYGWATLLGVVFAIVIVVGWQIYRRHAVNKAQHASLVYATMMSSAHDKQYDVATQAASMLQTKFPKTAYADLANLWLASRAVTEQHYSKALTDLQTVEQHGKMKSLRQLAALRMAQIYLQQNQAARAITALKPVYDKSYEPQINAVLGDAYKMQGNVALARAAYQKAGAGFAKAQLPSPMLAMKLADLPQAHTTTQPQGQ